MRVPNVAPGLLAVAFAVGCTAALELEPSDADEVLARHLLEAPSPAEPGPYEVGFLYYGSGTDLRRPEYRDSVAFTTTTVDASPFVDLGRWADERNAYWGFSPDSFPRNARVWYPEGDGPFPLVLVVHGNHDMKDFSDPGYAWLGELLASRGYIVASVDENFLNGRIRGENDARAWMLLEHLAAWREFAADPENPFHGKVDLDRVALIGHSRGGEAVAHAAAFNRLERYPDDANVVWDFGFGIRSVIAIAPVDGQYEPADRLVPVRDVSYLVFHGSHDGDVSSFVGLRTYDRVRFTGPGHFKAAVYVYRANHGQWNTVWGAHDRGPRSGRSLDLRGLLDPEDQRAFGRAYVSAFLDATVKGDDRYLPLFRDHRLIGDWLPPTMYITRFEAAGFRPVADFREDVDVTRGSVDGVLLRGDSLGTWREAELPLRWRGTTQENHAVWLGWNNRVEGEDSATARPASYTIALPEGLAADWHLAAEDAALQFLLSPTPDEPDPRERQETQAQADTPSEESPANRPDPANEAEPGPEDEDEDEDEPVDLTLEAVDADGDTARVVLSRYGAVRRPLRMNVLRRPGWDEDRFRTMYELVLQSYAVPLRDFAADDPAFDPGTLRQVRFLFDRTAAGTVVVDEIGFVELGPAWWRARMP